MKDKELRLGLCLAILTKKYFGVLSKKLEHLDIERYFFVLVIIKEDKASCTQQYIADALQVDKVAMVKIIDYLSKKGYILRERNPKDRREIHIRLTDKGNKKIEVIYSAIDKTNKEATFGIPKKQKDEFFKAMGIINRNLCGAPSKKMILEVKKS
jgi:DNA-binding MarR family transcriptional regulator